MSLHKQLLDSLIILPNTDTANDRRALINYTDVTSVSPQINLQGHKLLFFDGLITALTMQGKDQLLKFLDNLTNTNIFIGPHNCNQEKINSLKEQIAELNTEKWPNNFNQGIQDLRDSNQWANLPLSRWREACRFMLGKSLRQRATEEDFELNIFVPLGLIKRKKQQRRPAE